MTDDFQIKRKLTAILAADVVSFSRMASENEEQTLRILAEHRRVIDAIIQAHGGRIVNTAGDSVLAEFTSSVEAVRCAIEMQEAIKTRNDALADNQRMPFRIGVNLGDVMISGTDLLGDGVNIAARLQSIAEPGGICISSSVYDQISGKINLGFADLGEQSLKNINRLIHVYQLEGANAPIKHKTANAPRKLGIAWGVAGLAIAAAGLALAWRLLSPESPPGKSLTAAQSTAQPETGALEQARLDAERTRAQAELEKARAEGQVAKMQAELELQKARAEGQMAKMQAELKLQKARAETEQLKRSSEAETRVKAATAARPEPRVTPSAPPALPPVTAPEPAPMLAKPEAKPETAVSAQWISTLACEAFEDLPKTRVRQPAALHDGEFIFEKGNPGKPGYVFLQGKPINGQLAMIGSFISNAQSKRGYQGNARFSGSLDDGGSYLLNGNLGRRLCSLTLEARN